jgi:hypothetical protein
MEIDGLLRMPTPENGGRKFKKRLAQIRRSEQGKCFSMEHIYCKTLVLTLDTVCPSIYYVLHFIFLPQIPFAVGSLNLTPHSQYRDLAWRLWTIFPKLDRNSYKGDDFAQRNAELFHACLKPLVDNLQALSEEWVQLCVEGRTVNFKILLAVITGDHPQQALHCLSRNGCLYCRCPLDQLDDTTRVYEPITVQEQERLMCDICDEYLDENGKIKPGKITDFHKAEQELGFRILRNAWWGVSDTFFCFKLTCSFQPFPKPLLISLLLSSPSTSLSGHRYRFTCQHHRAGCTI